MSDWADDHQVMIDVVEVARDGTTHTYWSTHCRHALAETDPVLAAAGHAECGQNFLRRDAIAGEPVKGLVSVVRRPAQCKNEKCQAPCVCPCHEGAAK